MSFAAIAAVTAVGGVALSAKGMADQKKQQKKALEQDQANYEAQQAENWRRYKLSRGLNGSKAVNTKLPLWMTVKRPIPPKK